jgi:glycosyltransferase involved in cell wall biosynthesis
MNRWQGIAGFATVVEEVIKARQDVSFLFVGEGEGRAALAAELEKRGCLPWVLFAGRLPHSAVPCYVAAMDVGILLDSNAYGSPMKVFEYWAMGKAVIAPSVDPVLEILRDGETGLLIAPGDARNMAAQILRLAGDPELRHRLGDQGRREVLATHTWARNAEQILLCYEANTAASTRSRSA